MCAHLDCALFFGTDGQVRRVRGGGHVAGRRCAYLLSVSPGGVSRHEDRRDVRPLLGLDKRERLHGDLGMPTAEYPYHRVYLYQDILIMKLDTLIVMYRHEISL